MQKLWTAAKQIVIFFTLWVFVIWFSAEVVFALFGDKISISEDDLQGSAGISFILVYAIVKPFTSHFGLKQWSRYILYFIIYTFLFLLISFM